MLRKLNFINTVKRKQGRYKIHICSVIFNLPNKALFSYSEKCGSDVEINEKRECVNDSCNERACHDRRVKSDPFCEDGESTADELCDDYRDKQRYADDCGNGYRNSVYYKDLNEVCGGEGDTAKN